ncbi:DNA topoisomerase IB [Caldimonas aquatica]|uniref:DNA topoisomerase n=1 Tax=Caldimonas aquatica TaxID=376175 RepID=A0ABY6MV25_9BURK|nr:DNA topoisomerase IB [Schlegelella aquatica]UZD55865.1 DNA topoisomerase IB [Schlegelella aquatica]
MNGALQEAQPTASPRPGTAVRVDRRLSRALKELLDQPPPKLVYVNDTMPGYRRVRRGDAFEYLDTEGRPLRDEAALRRIRSLAIPPAYTDVWICPRADGHLQATGRDARGRKQYRYHPYWQVLRDCDKFDRMLAFGEALPRIRARVRRHLALRGLPREKVLAALVQLLDTTFIRVGNDEYARENGSFGLTTLRTRHAAVRGDTLRLKFKGKSGVLHDIAVTDRQLARIVRRCQELPGQDLFQYLDEAGEIRSVGSTDVNDYLRDIGGSDFTAKDFRTWHGSVQALEQLGSLTASSPTEAKRMVKAALSQVAERLGNTVAVCRKSYVHPKIVEAFLEGKLQSPRAAGKAPRALTPAERRLMAFLRAGSAA